MSRPTPESCWGEVRNRIRFRLEEAGIESPAVEAELMLAELLKIRRPELFFHLAKPCDASLLPQLENWLVRRLAREPWQYIVGHAPFMNFELEVTPEVLIPRPETELLVEFVLRHLPQGGTLLDVGCGSGAIALSVAQERKDATIMASDVSGEALAVAKRNAEKYHLSHITFFQSDLLTSIPDKSFDFLTANLPYIAEEEYGSLQPEVKNFEPKLALTAADNGLALIARCIEQAPGFLKKSGRMILEIGARQSNAVAKLLHSSDRFDLIEIQKDYNQFDRFVSARKKMKKQVCRESKKK